LKSEDLLALTESSKNGITPVVSSLLSLGVNQKSLKNSNAYNKLLFPDAFAQ
jgi:hypothetical protein